MTDKVLPLVVVVRVVVGDGLDKEGSTGAAGSAQLEQAADGLLAGRTEGPYSGATHEGRLLGLIETLGGPGALRPNPAHKGSTTFCRIVFYRRQTGRRVDLTRYIDFCSKYPDYPSIDQRLLHALYTAATGLGDEQVGDTSGNTATLNNGGQEGTALPGLLVSPNMERSRRLAETVAAGPLINPFDGSPAPPINSGTSCSGVNVPSWQRSAPRNELQVDRTTLERGGPAGSGDTGSLEAPYSDKFAKVVEAVQSGKELEGIKQIPDIVVRQAGITPIGKLKAPRKPWEKAALALPTASELPSVDEASIHDDTGRKQPRSGPIGSLVDMEFPEPPPSPPSGFEDVGFDTKTEVKDR
ncbi:hypothetical protein SEPCBS57363_002782 [Sporothrix epigloea]|uniref:Peroxisomal membrane protein PEX14-like KPWE domain-containing protein n=1 Tax=Sporothrix epigloea TaxID=1892477 RepID=A0ABP0DHT1_9PEZI